MRPRLGMADLGVLLLDICIIHLNFKFLYIVNVFDFLFFYGYVRLLLGVYLICGAGIQDFL